MPQAEGTPARVLRGVLLATLLGVSEGVLRGGSPLGTPGAAKSPKSIPRSTHGGTPSHLAKSTATIW